MYDPTKPYKTNIKDLIKQTWNSPYVLIKDGIYPIIERKFSFAEVDHTDGIGTKGIYHWEKRTFRSAALDALAMNLNDLALMRAVPYKLQNHIVIPEDDQEAILEIVESLAKECQKRNIAITGGETSVHNLEESFDISITISGFIEKPKQNKFKVGDCLVGIQSNGLHSNGFTKVREIFGTKFYPEFIKPTVIYSDAILELDKKYDIHGMMHITGGAFTKIKDLLDDANARINRDHKLVPQSIFKELYKRGISDEEMYQTFNCGIGFVLSVSPKDAESICAELKNADIIGRVAPGANEIIIESMFSDQKVRF